MQGRRRLDVLAVMFRRGSISLDMRLAGERLRQLFTVALVEPLSAYNFLRVGADYRPPHAGKKAAVAQEARCRILEMLEHVGGLGSPGGACVWHVLCCERSLKEWASAGWSGRRVSQESASGIMIGALGGLEAYFRRFDGGTDDAC